MKNTQIPFETASGKASKISGVDSKYHIEVRPSDVGVQDRVVVQSIIKDMASLSVDQSIYKKPFRVVIMQEADLLTFDAQQALRRTMEKYAGSCKLFLCCTSLNKIIEPIISRCMVIRLPSPTSAQMLPILRNVAKKENLNITDKFCNILADKSDRNLRRAVLMLEASVAKGGKNSTYDNENQLVVPDWKVYISTIVDRILANPSGDAVLNARSHLYELINRLIPRHVIFESLVLEFCKRLDDKAKYAVYRAASKYQHMSLFGEKPIIFLEGFLLDFMCLSLESK